MGKEKIPTVMTNQFTQNLTVQIFNARDTGNTVITAALN
jgi:uncharacterized lipoprotein YmbA